ncbi:MAG: FAD-binding oxidoreductase [Parachlamydiaceae bacterium]|nr:FAD-binding oxidoreductase [Parachlamydiaceae bacterium]
MSPLELHTKDIIRLQREIKLLNSARALIINLPPIALNYQSGSSYTIRSKSYKKGCHTLDCGALDRILSIDPKSQIARVEPRVTMSSLVRATLAYGLMPPIVPEFKNITVGGAILGIAAESGSHRWGCFNDACAAFEMITADGSLIRASPHENIEFYNGIPGSYGSFGPLVSAEIKLIPVKKYVRLRYRFFSSPHFVVEELLNQANTKDSPDFLDGLILSKNLAVVIEGFLVAGDSQPNLPQFSTAPTSSPFYWQHVKQIALESNHRDYEEIMDIYDYLFRYDLGAFWIGSYLFHLPLLKRVISQGILKWTKPRQESFDNMEIQKFKVFTPNASYRAFLRPLMNSKFLNKLLHKSEDWVQNRFMIQDFCIPESTSLEFLGGVLVDPKIFPIWLLPIKGTSSNQIFAPHLLSRGQDKGFFMNFGIYGVPAHAESLEAVTRRLEKRARELCGRKVLYSCSYYTQEEFWEIYSRHAYEDLRKKIGAKGFWHNIVDKVLSK